ncbi:substrate-binding domain-containing protein [Paenibacillus sp. MMO-58]|uniref:substrate-binding domain-containing protein n=1 Tax=Paenibacillus sp. MMO-58 TaxID=3081290 RepID=UPI003016B4B2
MVFSDHCHDNEILRFFIEHPEIDGVLTGDLLAAQIIQISNRLGKKIPEDIKLIGYNDVKTPSLLSPRLSSVRQPVKEMSEYIIESIIKQIEGEDVPMLTPYQSLLSSERRLKFLKSRSKNNY